MRFSRPFSAVPAVLMSLFATSAGGQEAAKQCEMISALTGDYYVQRQAGKQKQELQQSTPPAFADSEFARTIDLAINLAFKFDESLNEDQVETRVYDSCMKNHPG